jgi:hypothetical protein
MPKRFENNFPGTLCANLYTKNWTDFWGQIIKLMYISINRLKTYKLLLYQIFTVQCVYNEKTRGHYFFLRVDI